MKKVIFIGVLIIASLTSAYFYLKIKTSEENKEIGPTSFQLKRAMSATVSSNLKSRSASIRMLIPGAKSSPGIWDFRGSLNEKDGDKPFYGTVRSTCDEYENLKCWRLHTLNINGMKLDPYNVQDDEQSEKSNTGKLTPVTKNNASIKKLTAQPAASPKSLVVAPGEKKSTAPPEKAKINRWRAKQNGVNGRTGPGTQFNLAFKIDKSLTLELKRRDGNWGLFSYPAINGETGEIWIYLSLMKAY